jgi:hypothetical protein
MTQAYNLSQLANNLNTAGQLDATDGLVGAVPPANGGTGQSTYAVGDLLYASGATALAKLPDIATGNVLVSGGVNVAPSYGKVGLTTHVSGTLPVTSGGTGLATITANALLVGAGTGSVTSVSPGTSGNVLTSNGTAWTSAASSAAQTLVAVYLTGAGQTFTVPAGITKVKVTIIGGGGNGGTGSTSGGTGGGGGGGGTAIKWLAGLTPGGTLSVTVGGASGTSSVSSGVSNTIATVSATGGGNGANGGAGPGTGGAGGTGSAGTLNVASAAGGVGTGYGGAGASSLMGFGGAFTSLNGGNGTGYGAGGAGGSVLNVGCALIGGTGGSGSAGLVLFEY